MSDEATNPLNPVDPPETVPPTEPETEADADSSRAADVPETQPPGSGS